MQLLQFCDRLVSYTTFLKDIAAVVALALKQSKDDPEYISQNMAYKMFGRANVERWRKNGLIEPCRRPGKNEYKTAELRLLQQIKQDYMEPNPKDEK